MTRKTQMSEKKKKFVNLMAKGYTEGKDPMKMSILDAFTCAGYAADGGNAYRMFKECKDLIQERRDELVDQNQNASLATKIIEDIMMDVKNKPEVRLKAAQDVLHRTGYDKPKELTIGKKTADLTDEEIDQQVSELIETSSNVETLKQA